MEQTSCSSSLEYGESWSRHEDDSDLAHVTHANDDDEAETAHDFLMANDGNEVSPTHVTKGELNYDMSVMDSNFYKLVKKFNIENDDKSQTKFINWSVRNGLMYVKSVGHDYCDLTSHLMNYFETVMALKTWKSLKALDEISRNENVVKLWCYFLFLKSSCLTDNDIRIMNYVYE